MAATNANGIDMRQARELYSKSFPTLSCINEDMEMKPIDSSDFSIGRMSLFAFSPHRSIFHERIYMPIEGCRRRAKPLG